MNTNDPKTILPKDNDEQNIIDEKTQFTDNPDNTPADTPDNKNKKHAAAILAGGICLAGGAAVAAPLIISQDKDHVENLMADSEAKAQEKADSIAAINAEHADSIHSSSQTLAHTDPDDIEVSIVSPSSPGHSVNHPTAPPPTPPVGGEEILPQAMAFQRPSSPVHTPTHHHTPIHHHTPTHPHTPIHPHTPHTPDIPHTPDTPVVPWTDTDIHVAQNVTDDMTFAQAFAAARMEVGPGGCFEWNGAIYATYNKEEWTAMSNSQRAAFGSHFNWDNYHPTDNISNDFADDILYATDTPEINIIGDNTEGITIIEDNDDIPDVEVLGVFQDVETGTIYGNTLIGDQQVILVDVDGEDNRFEYIATDIDGNGALDLATEVQDITSEDIAVTDLLDTNAVSDDLLSEDYVNDADVSEFV